MERNTFWQADFFQAVESLSSFYEKRNFIIVFIEAHHFMYGEPDESSSCPLIPLL